MRALPYAGILVIGCLWWWPTLAQEPASWSLRESDGLPSNQVFDILEDRQGYMWFATSQGVCRYDGRVFRIFQHRPQFSRGMTNLTEDNQGRIWMVNFSGQVFYWQQDSLHLFDAWQQIPAQRTGVVVTGEQLLAYTKDTLYTQPFSGKQGLKKAFRDIFQESGLSVGKSLPVLASVLSQADNINCNFYQIGSIRLNHQLTVVGVWRSPGMYLDLKEAFLLVNPTGSPLYKTDDLYQPHTPEVLMHLDYPAVRPLSIIRDRNGWYWICTDHGVQGLQPSGQPVFEDSRYLPNQSVSDVCLDRTGRYWISTLWDGIYVIPDLTVQLYPPAPNGLQDRRITRLALDRQQRLWVGTASGGPYVLTNGRHWQQAQPQTPTEITSLYADPAQQTIWASSSPGGRFQHSVFQYDAQTLRSPTPTRSLGSAKDMTRYKQWMLVASNIASVAFADTKDAPTPWGTCFDASADPLHNLVRTRAWAVLTDTVRLPHRIWLGHANELWMCDGDTLRAVRDPETGHALAVRDLAQSTQGIVWVGTSTQGVWGFRGDSLVARFTEEQGLPGNSAIRLQADGDTLFVASNRGIVRWVYPHGPVHIYDLSRGLISHDITDMALAPDVLWVATGSGLQRVPRRLFDQPRRDIPIYLTGMAIWEKNIPLQPAYTLRHNQNNLRFDFSGLDYNHAPVFVYQYRLIGLDSTWITLSATQQSVRFPALDPGTYVFEVRAVPFGGKPDGTPARLTVTIRAPWWATWWFRVLAVLTLSATTVLLTLWGLRRLQQDRQIEQQLYTLKMSALQAQMNPHFIFNALNAIQHYLTLSQTESALHYLSQFARLIRYIFDHSRREQVSLDEELSFLQLYTTLEQLRFGDRIAVVFDVAPDLEPGTLTLPPLLIQPLLENAFKHGLWHKTTPGTLHLHVGLRGAFLYVRLEDDGIGRQAAQEIGKWRAQSHESAGLHTIQERITLYNRQRRSRQAGDPDPDFLITDLYDTQGQAAGTRVELWIVCAAL